MVSTDRAAHSWSLATNTNPADISVATVLLLEFAMTE
jgi:hypothetical protein